MNDTQPSLLPTLDLELRRGVIVLAVLSQLQQPRYGYALKKALAGRGLEVDEGTLYPLLRRLEAQGLLASEWRVEEGRPRRYYEISPEGRRAEAALRASWAAMVDTMNRLLGVGGA
jgi:DNA-binding PadR family transcriptional regulator